MTDQFGIHERQSLHSHPKSEIKIQTSRLGFWILVRGRLDFWILDWGRSDFGLSIGAVCILDLSCLEVGLSNMFGFCIKFS